MPLNEKWKSLVAKFKSPDKQASAKDAISAERQRVNEQEYNSTLIPPLWDSYCKLYEIYQMLLITSESDLRFFLSCAEQTYFENPA